jgi:Tol biopolymer transport system component
MEVYAWSGDGTKIRTAACDTATCTGWDISLVGGTRRRSGALWPVTDFVISGPDGSRLLRITNTSRELWVDLVDGSAPRRLVDLGPNGSASWSADGERVLFTRGVTPSTVESMPVAGGSPSVVFKADEGHRIAHTEPPIGMFLELRDGRLLMLLSDTQTNAVAVWEVPIGGSSGAARGSPRRLTEGRPGGASVGAFSGFWILNASLDGQRVVLKSDKSHGDIYVARFDERRGRLLDTPRQLTTDERGSFPGAWTADGESILFNSGKSGSQDIFTQRLGAESAEPLVVGPGNQVLPRMSSDGQWVLFLSGSTASRLQPASKEQWRLMRVPLAGGRPEQVLATAGLPGPRCSIRGRCVLFEEDRGGWIISSLDPVRGKGERLFMAPFDIRGGDLSPDGNALALVLEGSRPRNRIRIYSLGGEPQQDVVVENASTLVGLDWAATGTGLFSSNVTPSLSELLFIRLDGTSHVLWSQRGTPVWAVPSPDGAHLAIGALTRQSNIWMLTDF